MTFMDSVSDASSSFADGRPAEIYTANGYRMAVDVPQGRHQVRFWIDRRPLHRALAGALAGLLLLMLPGLAWWGRRGRISNRIS